MDDRVRVMIQFQATPMTAATAFGLRAAAPAMGIQTVAGLEMDASFSPVAIPMKPPRATGMTAMRMAAAAVARPSGFLSRASVPAEEVATLLATAEADPNIAGVFADPRISPVAVCPTGPVGTDEDVEDLLRVDALAARGMNGSGVKVVIVDTGVNMTYLNAKGKHPAFDKELSWGPRPKQPLGEMPVGHGTMCGYDVCIAAPKCTLVDHALLTSTTSGGSDMDGLLSDAVKSYGELLNYLTSATSPFVGDQLPRTIVVNNSWAMFHSSWDFPVGDPQNYSDNPDHPFNIIVASLEAAGADILFAAGNCGAPCPDGRCRGVTDAGIFGANSSPAVTSVAGVVTSKERIGYSSQGPGRLVDEKPDLASFTHFAGSGVYPADGGTSTAAPVLAGVVAAIRRVYPASVLSPAMLRDILRDTAEPVGSDFNYDYGHGIVNVEGILDELDSMDLHAVATGVVAMPTRPRATKKKTTKKKAAKKKTTKKKKSTRTKTSKRKTSKRKTSKRKSSKKKTSAGSKSRAKKSRSRSKKKT